jgi:signal transduction histidine kinase/ligand-binding sensor domain-containing protein
VDDIRIPPRPHAQKEVGRACNQSDPYLAGKGGCDRLSHMLHRPCSPARTPRDGARSWRLMLKVGWLAAWLIGTSAFTPDPHRAIPQFVHTSWTEKDGAPADIRALAQTTDGYLWIGTPSGLFRFDGLRFTRFEPQAGESLPARLVGRLLASRDGALWIVWGVGAVSRVLDGHVTSYSEREGLPATEGLVEAGDGSVIAGTVKGLWRFKDGVWEDVGKAWSFPPKLASDLYFDKAGALWVLTEDRILYLPPGRSQFVDPGEPSGPLHNFAQAPDGAIWISDPVRSARTVRRSGDRGPVTEVRVGASQVLFDRNGSLWVGTYGNGLRRIAYPDRIRGRKIAEFGPEAEQFTVKDGLSANYVRAALEDREGNIWWGTLHGLDRFRQSTFTPTPVPNPDVPRAILATGTGGLWTFSSTPFKQFEQVRIGPRGDLEVITPGVVTAMCEDETGALWAVGGDAFLRFQRDRFVRVPLPGDDIPKELVGITCGRAAGIWLLDQKRGLFRFADGALTRVTEQSQRVQGWGYLYTDRRGRIWKGQSDRVVLYDHGSVKDFGAGDNVPPGLVFTIYEDRAGSVWVGGEGGLSKFENGRFRALSKPNGFPAGSVFGMTEDDDGDWWIATDIGVLRIPSGELDHAIADPGYRVHHRSFNLLDGLPGTPRQGFPMPVVARTADGRIWFATSDGPASVDPRRIPRNSLPPPVHVETVKLDGKGVAPADGMTLSHRITDLEIDYTALSLSIPERVRFRYKLEGRDKEWRDAGTRRQAYYSGLAPKEYRFRVMASNNDGVWNEAGAVWSFSIEPAFYQTAWFRVLCALAGAGLIWAVGAVVVRRRTTLATALLTSQFQAALAERTRIAQELHDTLLQAFTGVTLQLAAIQRLLAQRGQEGAEALKGVLASADTALRDARRMIWDMRPAELEDQDLAAALETAAHSAMAESPARLVFVVKGDRRRLPLSVETAALRIGREAVLNAVTHAAPRTVEVSIEYAPRLVTVRVRDDGVGIAPGATDAAAKGEHLGIIGMRDRAQRAGGTLEISSEPGRGTVVSASLPIREMPGSSTDPAG